MDYGPLKFSLFQCQRVKLTGGGVIIDNYGMTIVDLNKIGYRDEPFVLANAITQVFYVKDMSSKPIKKDAKSNDQPKHHIVLIGKRKIIEVEDKTDISEYYDQFDDLPPFSVDVDPTVGHTPQVHE